MLSTTEPVILTAGYHKTRAEGFCIMELVAFVNGEPHTDAPLCTHPTLSKVARDLNDFDGRAVTDEIRTRALLPLVPLLPACKDGGLADAIPLALADYICDLTLGVASDPYVVEGCSQVLENRCPRHTREKHPLHYFGWALDALSHLDKQDNLRLAQVQIYERVVRRFIDLLTGRVTLY
jgi:hypothetical protein